MKFQFRETTDKFFSICNASIYWEKPELRSYAQKAFWRLKNVANCFPRSSQTSVISAFFCKPFFNKNLYHLSSPLCLHCHEELLIAFIDEFVILKRTFSPFLAVHLPTPNPLSKWICYFISVRMVNQNNNVACFFLRISEHKKLTG